MPTKDTGDEKQCLQGTTGLALADLIVAAVTAS